MRHRRMLAPINTQKHYVHHTNLVIATGTVDNQRAVVAVAGAPATTADVQEGAVIKAVYVERWIVGDSGVAGTPTQFTFVIEKKRVKEADMTFAESQNLGSYENKKNILFTSQGIVTNSLAGGPTLPVFRNWVLIPKGKQRFGLDDELVVNIAAVNALRNCGIETFKEYT